MLDWDEGSMRIRPMSMVPPSARQCISSIRETRDSLAVTFVNPHPSLDRLTRHHTVLGGARPVGADAKGQQETDYEKAQIAADWLEGISAGLGTSNVGDIVTALRKPQTTSLSRPSSIVPPEGC